MCSTCVAKLVEIANAIATTHHAALTAMADEIRKSMRSEARGLSRLTTWTP